MNTTNLRFAGMSVASTREPARRLRVLFIPRWYPSGEGRDYLEDFGFRAIDQHQDGQAIPSRFQPLDWRGGNIRSALSIQDGAPICTTDVGCPWYWTKSDADQDRPN